MERGILVTGWKMKTEENGGEGPTYSFIALGLVASPGQGTGGG